MSELLRYAPLVLTVVGALFGAIGMILVCNSGRERE